MESGYSWFVTDALAVIEHCSFTKSNEFLCIKLLLNEGKGRMVITDGNDKKLYSQEYEFTDAQKELKLFWTGNVLMLSNEY